MFFVSYFFGDGEVEDRKSLFDRFLCRIKDQEARTAA